MRAGRCVVAIVAAWVTVSADHAVAVSFYAIGSGDDYDLPSGVSPDGSIVVTTRHIWTRSGGMVDISAGSSVYSRDVSNNGVVAGLWCGSNTGSCYEAFRSQAGMPIEGIGALDDWASDAFAVTPDGSVVVGNTSSETVMQSFRWTSATGMIGIGSLSSNENSHSAAFGVSTDGSVVVGRSGDDLTFEAYRWTAASGMVGLGALTGGSGSSGANDVSADGQIVVGYATTALGQEAFRWSEANGMVGLGDLAGGDYFSFANAVTANGAIVVGESSTVPNERAAFIWTTADGMRSLQDVLETEYGLGPALNGWKLTNASDISHDGTVIVGYAQNPLGKTQGFVVIIPEPSALVLSAVFVSILAMQSSRKMRPRVRLRAESSVAIASVP